MNALALWINGGGRWERAAAGPQRLALSTGQARTLADGGAGLTVTVRRGRVWLTGENGGGDHILSAGDTLTWPHPGRVVVQALVEAQVDVGRSEARG